MTPSREADAVALLPCPFCGGAPELNDYTAAPACAWVLVHRDKACPIAPQILHFSTEEKAIAAWNRRAPAPQVPDKVGDGAVAFMYAYECVDTGRWKAFMHQLKRADGSICPGKPLYAAPPAGQELREKVVDLILDWLDERDIASVDGDEGLADAILSVLQSESPPSVSRGDG